MWVYVFAIKGMGPFMHVLTHFFSIPSLVFELVYVNFVVSL